MFITDKDENKYFSKESAIDLSKNEIATKDIEVYFAKNSDLGDHARLKGNAMISSENQTIIKKEFLLHVKKMILVHLGHYNLKKLNMIKRIK